MLGRPRYISETRPSGSDSPKCFTLGLGRLAKFSHGNHARNSILNSKLKCTELHTVLKVQRAFRFLDRPTRNAVRIDHCGSDIGMPKQRLDRAEIIACLQKRFVTTSPLSYNPFLLPHLTVYATVSYRQKSTIELNFRFVNSEFPYLKGRVLVVTIGRTI